MRINLGTEAAIFSSYSKYDFKLLTGVSEFLSFQNDINAFSAISSAAS
jgi:hypothetical protein